jgi:hypothetical protein
MDCCKQKGFSEKWLTWINMAISGGTLSVKVNDCVRTYFWSHHAYLQSDV